MTLIHHKMAQAMFERTHDQPWDEAIADPGSAAGIYLDDARAARAVVLAEMREMVNRQAEDDGLWFVAQFASEAYLQQELRKLHALIEGQIAQFEKEQAGG